MRVAPRDGYPSSGILGPKEAGTRNESLQSHSQAMELAFFVSGRLEILFEHTLPERPWCSFNPHTWLTNCNQANAVLTHFLNVDARSARSHWSENERRIFAEMLIIDAKVGLWTTRGIIIVLYASGARIACWMLKQTGSCQVTLRAGSMIYLTLQPRLCEHGVLMCLQPKTLPTILRISSMSHSS